MANGEFSIIVLAMYSKLPLLIWLVLLCVAKRDTQAVLRIFFAVQLYRCLLDPLHCMLQICVALFVKTLSL